MHLFYFPGNECDPRLRVHGGGSLPDAGQHIGCQQTSRPWLVEGGVEDFLWEIGGSKSIATILFPVTGAALQNDSGH